MTHGPEDPVGKSVWLVLELKKHSEARMLMCFLSIIVSVVWFRVRVITRARVGWLCLVRRIRRP